MEYPHAFENGAGECLTFTRRAIGLEGERVEGETRRRPGTFDAAYAEAPAPLHGAG